jgi:peptidoglycan/LPS O-acetylase OafA/YrhL
LVFAAALVLALAYRDTKVTVLLRCKVGGLIASLSYCIYLTHLALIDLYVHGLKYFRFGDIQLLGYVGAECLRLVVIGAATMVLALVSRKYLEGPFLRLKRHL